MKPSEDLERLIIEGYLDKEPFNKIKKLNNIEQNPKYHPEGSVLKHVLLVVDLASEYKKYSNDEKVFMWAALLHDIGKLTTTRVRKNRITSYNHDTEGKDIAMNILNELTDDEEFKQKVSKLVRWHMQPLFYDKNLPFFQPQDMINDVEYKEVALLSLCDRLGRGNLDEVEETMTELKSQIYELKKNQIDADSIYGFLGAFNEVYSECTDAEKKQFMQAFIERIDIFPERREDGNWIQNIKFQFPVPIIKEGKEVAQIKGISLDKEKSDEHMVSLEKLSTLETVCLLSKLHEAKHHVNVTVDMDEMDITSAESKATYEEIKKYVAEHNDGMKVTNLYIAQVKKKCGIIERENYNKPKSEDEIQPQCPKDKEKAIEDALRYFQMK